MAPGTFALTIGLPSDTTDPSALEMDATDWMTIEEPTVRRLVFVLQRILLE
jgi:hypothetical protein